MPVSFTVRAGIVHYTSFLLATIVVSAIEINLYILIQNH